LCHFGSWGQKWGGHETVPGLVGKTIGPVNIRIYHGYG
jgi:hypothetical protein